MDDGPKMILLPYSRPSLHSASNSRPKDANVANGRGGRASARRVVNEQAKLHFSAACLSLSSLLVTWEFHCFDGCAVTIAVSLIGPMRGLLAVSMRRNSNP